MKIETLLQEEIEQEFEGLKEIELGTKEYLQTVDGLTKLMDRAIEIDKNQSEKECKSKQAERDQNNEIVKNCIGIANIIIPLTVTTAVTIWGTFKTFKFEETGTVTTIMGRGFINKLLPKK